MTEIIYCAASNIKYAGIAIRHGVTYGAQLPNKVYFSPEFVDQDWEQPDFDGYVKAVKTYRPRIASALDLERPDQLNEVLRWSRAIAGYVQAIVVIPKYTGAIEQLPRSIGWTPVRLGYSVPTKYGGTTVPVSEFADWGVHLLGGSIPEQLRLRNVLQVESMDNSQMEQHANNNRFYWNGRDAIAKNKQHPTLGEMGRGDLLNDVPYRAFPLSIANIKAALLGAPVGIRYAHEHDMSAIQKIAWQCGKEIGM